MNGFNDASSTSESDVLDLSNGNMDRNNGDSDSSSTIVPPSPITTDKNGSLSTEVYLEDTGMSDDSSDEDESFSGQNPQQELMAAAKVPSVSIEPEKDKKTNEDLQQLADIVTSRCCMKECLLHLTGYNILTARRKVCSLHGVERRQWTRIN